MGTSTQFHCLFSAKIERQNDGSAVIEVPEHELTVGELSDGGRYRIGVLPPAGGSDPSNTAPSEPAAGQRDKQPPVKEGEVVDVEIEDMGEEGDGMARVGPGYVVFVPDTEQGERVSVEITNVRENVAFGEVVNRYDTGL